jgi:RNA recognition motif-containing protein
MVPGAERKIDKGVGYMQGSKLYVGNLKYSATTEDLNQVFSGYGEVKYAKVMEGKGFGFVEMGTPEQAEAAMNSLNGQDFMGRPLRIDEARPRPERRPFGERRPSF